MTQGKFKIGELLLAQGLIDDDQLSHALNEHKRTGLMLGKIIVRLGFVEEDVMSSILGHQIKLKKSKRLGDILVDQGYITSDQIEKALNRQKDTSEKLGVCLVKLGFISESKLLDALSAQLEIPQVKLENFNFDLSAATLIPEEMARQHLVAPLYKKGTTLTVAMKDPSNLRTIDHVSFKAGLEVEPVMSTQKDIIEALDKIYGVNNETLSSLLGVQDTDDLETIEEAEDNEIELTDEEGRQVVKIVNSIVNEAVACGASDIHLEPQETFLQLRYRVDGNLQVKPPIPGRLMGQIISRLKILSKMDIAEKRKPLDGRFTVKFRGKEVDLRVNSFPSMLRKRGVTEKIVMRILDPEANQFGLDDMGVYPKALMELREKINLPNGIVLVTGPTGSGKSTTLYACVREINDPTKNISTMEDPVELNLDGVNQGQINVDAGFTFAAGIRALLRQDPDIMLLGEMRDQETASMAVEAALTGHLVLSTLHTNDSCGAFPRLLDMGLEPFLVTTAINGILAQRLVRKICKKCKKEVEVDAAVKKRLRIDPDSVFYRGKGCEKCNGSGMKGRAPLIEFLVPNEGFKDLVNKHASADELKRYAMKNCGLWTLRMDGISKAKAGVTTLEEALSASVADYDD
jgi:type IV pilus assembly protein PilB